MGGTSAPVRVGEESGGGVLGVRPYPGDRIEFLGAEAIDLAPGAGVTFQWLPSVRDANGRWGPGKVEPLAGATVTYDPAQPADRPGVIVASLTPHGTGRWTLTSMRLHFRVNGGPEQVREGVDVTVTVCAGEEPPLVCEPEPASTPE